MAKIGILIETSTDSIVKKSSLEALTVGRENGSNEIFAYLIDGEADAVKDILGQYGADHIVSFTDLTESAVPDVKAEMLIAALKQYENAALLASNSVHGRDLLARVAAKLNAPLALDCIAVDMTAKTVTRSHFSGKTVATIELTGNLFLCGLRPNTVDPAEAPCTPDVLEFSATVQDQGRMVLKERIQGDMSKKDITEADYIITGGRPIGSAENFHILEECAETIGAAVGASRAAVDAGYAPHAMQVGQTGKTVSPKLYIACGLSGSVQHFAGMKTSDVIVAINTDKDAPIFGKCDYGIIGDLFEVVPVLTEVLKR